MRRLMLLGIAITMLSGCADLARRAEYNERYYANQQRLQDEKIAQEEALIATIPADQRLECKMNAETALASERYTGGQVALRVYYTCLEMKLAKMSAKR